MFKIALIFTEGVINHYGVVLNNGLIAHYVGNDKTDAVLTISTLRDFLRGRKYHLQFVDSRLSTDQVTARAYALEGQLRGRYDLFVFNCESVARSLATGKRQSSSQVWGGALLLGLIFIANAS